MREASKVLGDVKNAMKAAEEAEQRGDTDDVIHPRFLCVQLFHLETVYLFLNILKRPGFTLRF